jgi:hypothetical protein
LLSTRTSGMSAPRVAQDLVGRQPRRRGATEPSDERTPASLARSPPDPHGVADDFELDLGAWGQSEAITDRLRNGDLSLGGEAHEYVSYW